MKIVSYADACYIFGFNKRMERKQNRVNTKRIEFLKTDFTQGFPAFCGMAAGRVSPGMFESILIARSDHKQREGFVHAGMLSTMADHTAGYAAYTLVPETHRILTIEFKINFFRPAIGEKIICQANVINQGKKLIVSESEIFSYSNNQKKRVSKATVTLMVIPEKELVQKELHENNG